MLKNRTAFLLCFLSVLAGPMALCQHLVGYWHNWNDASAPYVPLDQIDPRYDVVNVSFAVPTVGTYHDLQFVPDQVSPSVFEAQVQALRNKGRQVNISIGGATAPIVLNSSTERDVFVSSLLNIIGTYGFNGLDIDLEGSSLMVSGGSIAQPTDQSILLLIEAIGQVMDGYRALAGQKLYLSMAPETAFVQGGMSAYGSIWGAYLPVIHALRDSIDLLHVQLYNSGSKYGIDGGIYTQGTPDFIVSQTEAVIQGFSTAGGPFAGLPAHKVAVGLPACNLAAGGGYTDMATVAEAVRYLMGSGPQPGTYQLAQNGGYPTLGGLMTWSINWDAVATCDGAYSFAQIFEDVWGDVTSTAPQSLTKSLSPWPNPATEVLRLSPQDAQRPIDLIDPLGMIYSTMPQTDGTVRVEHLPRGLYQLRVAGGRCHRVVLQ